MLLQLRWFIPVAVSLMAWFVPRLGDPWLSRIERFGAQLARKKWAAVITIALLAIVIRLALLPVLPVPVPDTHDEFSYLIAADTFVHGRLTNPPHPLSLFFETFHVLQHPTYQSMYPPAQAVVLALGQLLGHPWIGVLLSMAAMCAAITWMLQAWLPAEWALLGGLLVILRIHLFSYWLEGYWGGAVAAIGGALVMGSLPRIIRRHRPFEAALLGIGLAMLANSRPLEGVIACVPVGIALLVWSFSSRSPGFVVIARRTLLPVLCVLLPTLAFMGYYNRRVTGNALLFPHTLDQRQYQSISPFVWQSTNLPPFWHMTTVPRVYSNPQFADFYNSLAKYASQISLARLSWAKCKGWEEFFLGSVLWIPFLALPWVFRDGRVRLLILQFLLCMLGLLAIYWFKPHYFAPMAATTFALLIQAMRHLRRWEFKGRPVGIFVTRMVVALVVARLALYAWQPPAMKNAWSWDRAQITKQLERTPDNHLVIVRYSLGHDSNDEWVYNAADIDHSKVVWARDIPGIDPKPLLAYYRGRRVWLLEADAVSPQLRPFEAEPSAETLSASGSSGSRGRQ